MPRLRKMRRKQKYGYHINRKRLNEKLSKQADIKCDTIRKAWDKKKSVVDNLTSMGLSADPNNLPRLKIPSGKESLKKMRIHKTPKIDDDSDEEPMADDDDDDDVVAEKGHVAIELEEQAKASYAKKKSTAHPLPKAMYRKLTMFLDKYGEDFEAMASDHTNYYQETASQLRLQVKRLKNIPQQWIPYLKSRGLLESTETLDGPLVV